MTPGPRPPFAEQCSALCPRFRPVDPDGRPRRARKSELLAGELDGAPVIAKRLVKPDPIWDWYFAREVAIYRAFAATPPPVRVPRLVAADAGVLVLERFEGPALATRRRPDADLPEATVRALLAAHEAFAGWPGELPRGQPPAGVRSRMRQRLLEDPVEGIEWIRAGLARCHDRGIVGLDTHTRALDALAAHAPIARAHGDLLLRNAFALGGGVGLVDWECAGTYAADWDLALVWSQLAPPGRAIVEAHVGEAAPRRAAFWALVVFALAREVVFLEAFRVAREHAGSLAVRADLTVAEARLAARG